MGSPGCGKRTLVKQAASDLKFRLFTFVCLSETNEHGLSKFIVKKVALTNCDPPQTEKIEAPRKEKKLFAYIDAFDALKQLPSSYHRCLMITNPERIISLETRVEIFRFISAFHNNVPMMIISDSSSPLPFGQVNLAELGIATITARSLTSTALTAFINRANPDSVFKQYVPLFSELTYATFASYTSDINYYWYLYEELFEAFVKPVALQPTQPNPAPMPRLYDFAFKELLKVYIGEYLYLPCVGLAKPEAKNIRTRGSNPNNLGFHREEELMINELQSRCGLSYVQALLLVACYIGSYTTTVDDAQFLAALNIRRKRSKKMQDFSISSKSVDIDRIMAIADYFMNLNTDPMFKTKLYQTNSLTSLNDLVTMGKLRRVSNPREPTIAYFQVMAEFTEVDPIASSINIKLIEYARPPNC